MQEVTGARMVDAMDIYGRHAEVPEGPRGVPWRIGQWEGTMPWGLIKQAYPGVSHQTGPNRVAGIHIMRHGRTIPVPLDEMTPENARTTFALYERALAN